MATARAGFRRGEPAVTHYERAAIPRGLVSQHRPGSPKPLVGDATGETPVAGHTRHVQVFDDDRLIPDREGAGRLVQDVGTDVRDPGMDASQPGRRRPHQ